MKAECQKTLFLLSLLRRDNMIVFEYNGPVLFYGRFICNWKGETTAESKAKAMSNLGCQYKRYAKMSPVSGGIVLSNKHLKEKEIQYEK